MLQSMLQQTKILNDISQPFFDNSPIRYFSALFKREDQFTYLATDVEKLKTSFMDSRCHEFAKRISQKNPQQYHEHRLILDLHSLDKPNANLADEYSHYYRVFKYYPGQNDLFVAFNFATKADMHNVNHYYTNHVSEIDNFCDYLFNRFYGFVKDNSMKLEDMPAESQISESKYQPMLIEPVVQPFESSNQKVEQLISPSLFKLTNKERSIINYTAMGMTSKEISENLKLSRRTVENHLYNIKKKLGIKISKEDLVFYLTGKRKKYVDVF